MDRKPLFSWFIRCALALLVLAAVVLLMANHFINHSLVKQKIEEKILVETGIKYSYQSIQLTYFPHPFIKIKESSFEIPDFGVQTIESIEITPDFSEIFLGKFTLGEIKLIKPTVNVKVSQFEVNNRQENSIPSKDFEEILYKAILPIQDLAPSLSVLVREGNLVLEKGEPFNFAIEKLDADIKFDLENDMLSQANVMSSIEKMTLYHKGQFNVIHGFKFSASSQIKNRVFEVYVDELSINEPQISVEGTLTAQFEKPTFQLELSAEAIDVPEVREFVVQVTGDESVASQYVFTYLRSGDIPTLQLRFKTDDLSDVDLREALTLQGRLSNGQIFIPQINQTFNEVSGMVMIEDGVLRTKEVSGVTDAFQVSKTTFAMGLFEDNDLFRLNTFFNADLAKTKTFLEDNFQDTETKDELDLLKTIDGQSQGELILGNSLDDLGIELSLENISLKAEHKKIPFPIRIDQGQLDYVDNELTLNNWDGSIGKSHFKALDCIIKQSPETEIALNSESASLLIDEIFPWLMTFENVSEKLSDIKKLSGNLTLSHPHFLLTKDDLSRWEITSQGTVQNIHVLTSYFPETIIIEQGEFDLNAERLILKGMEVSSSDSQILVNAEGFGKPGQYQKIAAQIHGTLGKNTLLWAEKTFNLPDSYWIKPPVNMSPANITWQSGKPLGVSGDFTVNNEPQISFDGSFQQDQIDIKKLSIKDNDSDARMTLSYQKNSFEGSFSGELKSRTFDRIFINNPLVMDAIKGNMSIDFPLKDNISVANHESLELSTFSYVMPSGEKISLDHTIINRLGPTKFQADIKNLSYLDYLFDEINMDADFIDDLLQLNIHKAEICKINLPGKLDFEAGILAIDFIVEEKGLDASESVSCLTQGNSDLTGTLDFLLQISAQNEPQKILDELNILYDITLSDGVYKKSNLLTGILEVLNASEIVKGRLPSLRSTEFKYNNLNLTGTINHGILYIEQFTLDAETLDLLGTGTIDMADKSADLEFLAAPFKTANRIIRMTPGINYILAGTIVNIPISVDGPINDPNVSIMNPSAVGKSLLDLGKRTINAPIKLIETIIPTQED